MKNFILIFLLGITNWLSAQCFINGKTTLFLNQEETYTVDEVAQCKECYHWTVGNSEDVKLISEPKCNSIKLKGAKVGRVNLSISMLTNNGVIQCSKSIDVIAQNTVTGTASTSAPLNCDIDVTDFKELRYSENQVVLIPNETQKSFSYQWIVVYQSAGEKVIDEKVPTVLCSLDDPIKEVRLRNNSPVCTRKFSKTYPVSFWNALK